VTALIATFAANSVRLAITRIGNQQAMTPTCIDRIGHQ
jgi:hypothetical protein